MTSKKSAGKASDWMWPGLAPGAGADTQHCTECAAFDTKFGCAYEKLLREQVRSAFLLGHASPVGIARLVAPHCHPYCILQVHAEMNVATRCMLNNVQTHSTHLHVPTCVHAPQETFKRLEEQLKALCTEAKPLLSAAQLQQAKDLDASLKCFPDEAVKVLAADIALHMTT